MTWSLIRPLPDHPDVTVAFDWQGENVRIDYVGPSLQQLYAAGCITDEVVAAFGAGMRVLGMRDGSSCRRRRWYGTEGRKLAYWKIEWRAFRERALTLPGVTEPSVEPSMVERCRNVGRLQRPARWSVIEGKLIVVDWATIRGEALIA